MTRSHWLTPDAPGGGFICRPLNIPNSVEFVALVTGALMSLQEQYNWEPYGALTPVQVSALFRDMIDEFNIGPDRSCRMVGEIILYAGTDAIDQPWLLCDGTSLAVADFPELFAKINFTYGFVDDDHFRIPDLRGRVPIGAGEGDGLTPRAVGDSGGEEDHVLSIAELASHSHTDTGHTHLDNNATSSLINGGLEAPAAAAIPTVTTTGTGSANLTDTGSDTPHNTMQPFLSINYYIVVI